MSFKCNDFFMIRVPAISTETAKSLLSVDIGEVNSFITDNGLRAYLKEALLISSKTLYESFCKHEKDMNRDQSVFLSVYKYLMRAASRTTPYGVLAEVDIGNFDVCDNVIKKTSLKHKAISADYSWLCGIISELQKHKEVFMGLNLKWNNICYVSNGRVHNPISMNNGNNSDNIKENFSIKYTALVELIKNESQNNSGIAYQKLVNIIMEEYIGVNESKVIDTINTLVDHEYLFTDLRLPPYCDDGLEHVKGVLIKHSLLPNIVSKIQYVIDAFKLYNEKNDGEDILDDIIQKMKSLYPSDNYVEVNTATLLDNAKLDYDIKNHIETFVNFIAKIGVDIEFCSYLTAFKENFKEVYGIDVEVPLADIINPNGFDGLSLIDNVKYEPNDYENEIKKFLNHRVEEAIISGHNVVKLEYKDFDKFINDKCDNVQNSLDINFILLNDNDAIKLYLGPNFGADSAGKSFQRFCGTFDEDKLKLYNKFYKMQNDEQLINVELRELPAQGRLNNVINWNRNYKYTFSVGYYDEGVENNLTIEDIVIGISSNNKLYIRSKSNNKICKFVTDNMLNINICSRLSRLLYYISQEYYDKSILYRLGTIVDCSTRIYTPAIEIGEIVISPETWNLDISTMSLASKLEFRDSFKYFCEVFLIPRYFYVCRGDNRLLLNRDNSITIDILYQYAKASKNLSLVALEEGFFNSNTVTDNYGKSFVTECVFSLYDLDSSGNVEISTAPDKGIVNSERCIAPFDKGWIYLKVYSSKIVENDILYKLFDCKNKFGCKSIFFIRYIDESGRHLRIRIKYDDFEEAIREYKKIHIWLSEMRKLGLIKYWSIHEYEREINRYGGEKCIESAENLFCYNSEKIIKILRRNLSDNEFTIECFREVVYLLFELKNDLHFNFVLLDSVVSQSRNRKHYKKNRREYQDVLNECLNTYRTSTPGCIFADEIHKNKSYLSSTEEDIILSTIHMNCNRFGCNRESELDIYALVRHALYDFIRAKMYVER